MELCTLIFTARTKQKCKEKIEMSVFSVPRFETATVQQTKKKAKLTVYMERHNWHLMLNIDKHTTSYNMYCPYFFIRSILNIMCDSLNTLCCSFLITRSVGWLVVLRLNFPVNNFSVMSGRSHRFLGN